MPDLFEQDLHRLVETARRAAENPFTLLTADERQLIVCALAGNHPKRLAHLRMPMLRKLTKADK